MKFIYQKLELHSWWEHGKAKNKNKLFEWSADLKVKFCLRVLRLSKLPRCKEGRRLPYTS